MTIGKDATTALEEGEGTNPTFDYTPTATVHGILVVVSAQDGVNNATAVTWGGLSLIETADSPLTNPDSEDITVQMWFLGTGLGSRSGDSVVVTAVADQRACFALGVSSSGVDTEIQNTATINSKLIDPTGTITLSSNVCLVVQGIATGESSLGSWTELSGWTEDEASDRGATTHAMHSYDTIASDDVTIGWSQPGTDENTAIAVAIKESASAEEPVTSYTPNTQLSVKSLHV